MDHDCVKRNIYWLLYNLNNAAEPFLGDISSKVIVLKDLIAQLRVFADAALTASDDREDMVAGIEDCIGGFQDCDINVTKHAAAFRVLYEIIGDLEEIRALRLDQKLGQEELGIIIGDIAKKVNDQTMLGEDVIIPQGPPVHTAPLPTNFQIG